ncbi:MAG: 4a-hydroxytetrahydrobiopterin dehydratase [Sulfolobales archaeon]
MSEYKSISPEEARKMLREKGLTGWRIGRGKAPRIYKRYLLRDFVDAVNFINSIRDAAEELGHHPDLCIENYNTVRIFLTTHDIKGLSTMDIELAERIEKIYRGMKR